MSFRGFRRAFGRSLRLLCSAVILTTSQSLMLGTQEAHAEALEPAAQRIVSLVEGWFASLPEVPTGSDDLDAFVVTSPFDVSLLEGDLRDPGDFRAWVEELRSPHPRVAYELRDLRVDLVENGFGRARFEVGRRATNDEGDLHLSRRRLTWRFRDRGNGPLVLVGFEEERLILFPGTGPQIVCY
jgi:hypothetical protein